MRTTYKFRWLRKSVTRNDYKVTHNQIKYLNDKLGMHVLNYVAKFSDNLMAMYIVHQWIHFGKMYVNREKWMLLVFFFIQSYLAIFFQVLQCWHQITNSAQLMETGMNVGKMLTLWIINSLWKKQQRFNSAPK